MDAFGHSRDEKNDQFRYLEGSRKMEKLINFLYDPSLLVTVLTAVAAFATIIAIAMPMFAGDRLGARLKSVSNRREELRAKQRESYNKEKKPQLRQDPAGVMKRVVDDLNLRQLMEAPNTKMKLSQAGFRGQSPIVTFMFVQFALPIIVCAMTVIYLFVINDHGYTAPMRIALSFGGLLAGYYLPSVFLSNIIQKRQASIIKSFPDALDLLLICVEAGMSIEAAFNRVGKEVGEQSVELAEELGLTTAELSYLQDRKIAYENLALRTGLPGVKTVCTSLTQAERYGTPLGRALRVTADENRTMRMMAAEKKAAALPAKLTVPMILFFLPVLFVVILGPAAISFM